MLASPLSVAEEAPALLFGSPIRRQNLGGAEGIPPTILNATPYSFRYSGIEFHIQVDVCVFPYMVLAWGRGTLISSSV